LTAAKEIAIFFHQITSGWLILAEDRDGFDFKGKMRKSETMRLKT